jgi:hypothetical protein
VLIRFGYGLTEAGVMKMESGEYGICYPWGSLVYTPWHEEAFQQLYRGVEGRTLCTPDRCYMVQRFAAHATHLKGQFAECGVYRGATAFLIADEIRKSGGDRKLHLFDSFQGMPETDPSRDTLRRGDLGDVDLTDIQEFLKPFPFIEFHPGFIPGTFGSVQRDRFAFVNIDVDLYQSTLDCLTFFYEQIVPGGIIVCDDYGFLSFKKAARAAMDDFFRDKPEKPIMLRTSQCLVIKL